MDGLAAAGIGWRQLERFKRCGSEAVVCRKIGADEVRIIGHTCHSRWCEPCGRGLAWNACQQIAKRMPAGRARDITLTVRHSDSPLTDQISAMLQSFNKLRHWSEWRRRVRGGARFVEIKWNGAASGWHPHIHFLYDGEFFPQPRLKELWNRASDGSDIVYIQEVRSHRGVNHYATKYISKGCDASVTINPDVLPIAIAALRGRRLCGFTGGWKGIRLRDRNLADGEWRPVDRLDTLIGAARKGSAGAAATLKRCLPERRLQLVLSGTDTAAGAN